MTRFKTLSFSLAVFMGAVQAQSNQAQSNPAGLLELERQARAEGKILVVVLCPESYAQCPAVFADARMEVQRSLLRDFAVVATPDVKRDAYAARWWRREHVDDDPQERVYGTDGRLLFYSWVLHEYADADKAAASLDRGICVTMVHNLGQIPAGFRARNSGICRPLAQGVSY